MIDLSSLTGDYTASAGDVLTNATEYVVTVPAGATVTINGVTVTGGEAASEPPTFADGGAAITSGIVQGAGNTWTLSAFAELACADALAPPRERKSPSPAFRHPYMFYMFYTAKTIYCQAPPRMFTNEIAFAQSRETRACFYGSNG